MCVIILKPAGEQMPSDDDLRRCFAANPDGAGFMYPRNGKVHVSKGHMNLDDLMRELRELESVKDMPVVIHCRIGTQGPNNRALTHPFPISDSEKALTACRWEGDRALVHNGIIPLTSSWTSYRSKVKEQFSDTLYFVRDYASLICNTDDWHADRDKLTLLASLAESKLAILESNGHWETIGHFVEHEGCLYSNESFKPRQVLPVAPAKRGKAKPAKSVQVHLGTTDMRPLSDFAGSVTRLWSAAWDDDDLPAFGSVKGEYIPTGWSVIDLSTGAILDLGTGDDLYVVDVDGNVYLADDLADGVLFLENHETRDRADNKRFADAMRAHDFMVID